MEKKHLGFIAIIVILAVVLYFASQYIDLTQTMDVLLKANLFLLGAALVLETVSMALKTLKWKTLVAEINPNINFTELFKIQSLGIAVSNITPARVGEATKVFYLEKYGVKKRITLLTILWEHLFDIIAILMFTTLVASTYGSILFGFLILALLLIVIAYKADFVVKKLSHIKQLGFLSEFTLHTFKKKPLATALVIALGAWLAELTAVSLAFKAVGIDLPYTEVIGSYAIAIIIGLVSTVPGGLGSLDATMFLLLKESAPAATLAAAVIAARIVTIGWIYILGGLSALAMHKK
ncbi:MAG: lysylphosphatidylglycerol synthase transmembrane domain-containing protein [Candidatus Micrarchaeota archaeon]|nr:lysylphosphatidylglycerol synthase transmembrane domain-containing protein [Candidatus Micrarchaeota archaeon]